MKSKIFKNRYNFISDKIVENVTVCLRHLLQSFSYFMYKILYKQTLIVLSYGLLRNHYEN